MRRGCDSRCSVFRLWRSAQGARSQGVAHEAAGKYAWLRGCGGRMRHIRAWLPSRHASVSGEGQGHREEDAVLVAQSFVRAMQRARIPAHQGHADARPHEAVRTLRWYWRGSIGSAGHESTCQLVTSSFGRTQPDVLDRILGHGAQTTARNGTVEIY